MNGLKLALFAGAIALATTSMADGEQRFAAIGDLKLQSGKTLKDCQVGFRTFGTLSAKKDNVVLVPTWYLGTTRDLKDSFKPGGLVDSRHYYVIAVDALTNGVSTSPSNSRLQHDAAFPDVTIRDMVESQHKMLLGLGIRHLRGVLGISMGGFQTFQWVAAYPAFMDKAVPIVGSPQPTSYDLMFYGAGLKATREAIANPSARGPLICSFADFFMLALNTPTYYADHTARKDAAASFSGFEKSLLAWDPYDVAAGLRALMAQDIYAAWGGNVTKTAESVRAKMLIIVAMQDHCVNPAPALTFAQDVKAQTIILPGDQGHSAPWPEMARLSKAIDAFLYRS